MDNNGSGSRAGDADDRSLTGSTAESMDTPGPGPTAVEPGAPPRLAGPLVIYSVLRVGLIAVLTAVLAIFMPLIVALMFAIVLQLPLAWILFRGPRERVTDAMAQRSATRRAERQRLQSALSGEEPLQ